MKNKKDLNEFDKMFSDAKEVIILNPLYTVALDGLSSIRVENPREFYFLDELQSEHFLDVIEKSKQAKDEANKIISKNRLGALKIFRIFQLTTVFYLIKTPSQKNFLLFRGS